MSLLDDGFYDRPGLLAIHHVVVPAAVIAMVAALLFYLADVRSAFLGGGPQLKWIGLCFAVATVLIERYGRTTGESESQGCYTLALTGATAMVLLIAPWDTGPAKLEERLANLLILAVVWRFATRVTRGLSPESGERIARTTAFYGLDRLTLEAWQQKRLEETGIASRPLVKPAPPIPKNPAASVARLAAVALAAFALGEPVLLRAAPQTGVRALAAVIVFLFSTGIMMAAGASMDALRRAEQAGGRTDPSFLPWRLALAAGCMILLLAAGLGLPGLEFRGSGLLRPPKAPGQGEADDRGSQRSDRTDRATSRQEDSGGRDGHPDLDPPAGTLDGLGTLTGPAASLLHILAGLGKALIVPLALLLLGVGLWKLVRLWPAPGDWRQRLRALMERWRSLLRKMSGWLLGAPKKRGPGGPDPLAGLEELDGLPPRESVLAAYQRFLLLLDRLGSPRPGKDTPYDLLNHLPRDLRLLEDPARTLTELYVRAAYSSEPVEHGARERAVTALKGMQGLLASPAAR